MSMPSTNGFQSTSFSRSGNFIHSMTSLFGVLFGLREAIRTGWPAAANAELTAEPMKPEEPVTSIRSAIYRSHQPAFAGEFHRHNLSTYDRIPTQSEPRAAQ